MCSSVVRIAAAILLIAPSLTASGEERTQRFDSDPQWDGVNNRSTAFTEKTIVQRFGYSPTHRAGGKAEGEFGGQITPAAEPAFYGKRIPQATFDNRLTASGTFAGDGAFHVLVGFFNAGTLNEWRTPNTIAIRLQGRGDVFYAYVEYATSRWRAGGDSPGGFATITDPASERKQLKGFAAHRAPHRWTLTYDPAGHEGDGSIMVTIDDETAVCHLDPGHKLDGATFDHFGLLPVMKQWDSPGEVWLDDVTVNGEAEDFTTDPHWDAAGNQQTYVSTVVRPRFDFGFSPTHFAGGENSGELGGLVFRGDIREPDRMAHYGDRVETLTLERPLKASGTITLHRAVSDSTVLLGFYNSQDSLRTNPSQSTGFPHSFLGMSIEGPSRIGFQVYPVCHTADGESRFARGDDLPTILPDRSVHRWTLEYQPESAGGTITVTLDGRPAVLQLEKAAQTGTTFDRFGLVTTWIDGNGQHIYFDDLTYTFRQ
jgi:hypothetical protein